VVQGSRGGGGGNIGQLWLLTPSSPSVSVLLLLFWMDGKMDDRKEGREGEGEALNKDYTIYYYPFKNSIVLYLFQKYAIKYIMKA
jgi:hypothetical protein